MGETEPDWEVSVVYDNVSTKVKIGVSLGKYGPGSSVTESEGTDSLHHPVWTGSVPWEDLRFPSETEYVASLLPWKREFLWYWYLLIPQLLLGGRTEVHPDLVSKRVSTMSRHVNEKTVWDTWVGRIYVISRGVERFKWYLLGYSLKRFFRGLRKGPQSKFHRCPGTTHVLSRRLTSLPVSHRLFLS